MQHVYRCKRLQAWVLHSLLSTGVAGAGSNAQATLVAAHPFSPLAFRLA